MKSNRSLKLLSAGTLVGLAFGCADPSEAAPPLSMGYYPGYRTFPTAKDIRFDRFTHIIHSFIRADTEGKAVLDDRLPDATLIKLAHEQGAKVLFALGGGANGKSFTKMVRDPELQARFIIDVVKIVADNKADGIALDWELPEAQDKEITVDFVDKLRKATKAANPDSTLILVVNSKPNNSKGFDGPKLQDKVNYLQVMTYDFHGPWSHSGHHTPLYENKWDTVDGKVLSYPAALTYWRDVQGFPASKILFGLAGYGRGFKVKEWGEKPAEPSAKPEVSYRDIKGLIGNGWSRQWDDEAKAPWLLKDDKTDRISYDDEESSALKAAWMKQNGLAGFFIWEISQELIDGDYVLSGAAQKAWNATP